MISENKETLQPSLQTYIFDMDGVMYQLDGENHGYAGSALEREVLGNAIRLFAARSGSTLIDAQKLVSDLLADNKHLSVYAAESLQIIREDYFASVWGIDPQTIVQNYETSVKVVRHLAEKGKTLYLLSSAPSVWQTNVLNYLGVYDLFGRKYSAEMFYEKDEIFAKLAKELDPRSAISVGDQLHTDIEPARKLGFQTLHVTSPESLQLLIEN